MRVLYFSRVLRLGAIVFSSVPSDPPFNVDKPAASTSAASASDTTKDIPAKRKIKKKREKVLYHESLLKQNQCVKPIPSSVVSKKDKKKAKEKALQETQGQRNVPMEDDSAENNLDIWAGNGNGSTKAKKRSSASVIPAVEVEAPGCSFNPPLAHQDALAKAVADERQKTLMKELGPAPLPLIVPGEAITEEDKFFLDADDGHEDITHNDGDQDADTLVGQSIMNMEMPSVAEAAARKARINHSSATVTILVSKKEGPSSRKTALGSGFIIKIDKGRCKVMTCEHILEQFNANPDGHDLWVRYFHGDEDALATIKFADEFMDLAMLDAPQFPAKPGTTPPTILEFSKKRKIGTDIVLLGYFNPPAIENHYGELSVIAKEPNSVPGKIVGPLRYYPIPDKVTFPHSCYGIDETSGSPIISHESGKVLGVFYSSDEEIHTAIATRSVKNQLIVWLKVQGTPSMKDLIDML